MSFYGMASTQAAMPTPNRLAKPTLPATPSQADRGAQVYWLSCLPCHGDRGQGLTKEFIQVYPTEDQNCWASGCHGKHPYENGFTIPTTIPALIGPGTLKNFSNAATLHAYIFSAMPFWKPGSLTEEESWQVTAFLLRSNHLWSGDTELNTSNASQVLIGTPQAVSTRVAHSSLSLTRPYLFILAGFIVLILILFLQRVMRRK